MHAVGSNTHEAIGQWDVPCFVDRYGERRSFGWVTSDIANPAAQWRFDLAAIAGATRLRCRVGLGPGPSQMPDKEPRILARRCPEPRGCGL